MRPLTRRIARCSATGEHVVELLPPLDGAPEMVRVREVRRRRYYQLTIAQLYVVLAARAAARKPRRGSKL